MTDLSLDTLQRFDNEPYTRNEITRFLCPLCGEDKAHDNAHRCLTVRVDGVWHCMRCDERGVLHEFRKHARVAAMQHAYHKRTRATRTVGIFE